MTAMTVFSAPGLHAAPRCRAGRDHTGMSCKIMRAFLHAVPSQPLGNDWHGGNSQAALESRRPT